MKEAKKHRFLVKKSDRGERLDVFLSEKLSITRSQAQKMVKQDLVLVNGNLPKKAGERVKEKDAVKIKNKKIKMENVESIGVEEKKNIKNQKIKKSGNCKIISETGDYVVVEKPAGMLAHPTEANEADTLVDWLIRKYPKIKKIGDNSKRPGIVHRLDKEASGLLVVARNQKMFEHLKKQFQDRTIDKEYLVLVYGKMERQHDAIDFAIDRGKDGKMVSRPKVDLLKLKSMRSVQPGKEALTEFTVEKEYGRFSLLRVKIYTGRTHQIRVHMFAYNHPVVGDNLYFNRKLTKKNETKLNRLFLHAAKLCFEDLSRERMCFESRLPEELEEYLKNL
ncbi:MAG: hypothetical protein A3G00_02825 [Candidatus Magasanikbacteria bacterium RIFCSPLOWO2_12_FULL_43_12]|uniref:Pseudouridine synthase n=1 Tax=Candidatus Magasanikbacteria bacterium RIFCSPLOWO2_12_FULL_43_12 TaxID=1798692 RepID=A0A1F6MRD4_9BACT|nr:MAG: hypothetical protein A3I93_00350 [Candidatus Magasanikbacteria bacterium RIFCSPLOWO2_02_FULL_43_22]OGH72028.1 MAG: hypothetical protein A3C74_01145 [Candidatus Magasanikbacteria bacterium RIFCSPHIGHO2_02_FULL_44_13]OGH74226.1 MAG: hypothetical protein A3G00_02825 [Candidatus Magasanikbacteria bacterium RIFCSPLOWO2_12_FULL_43_12]